MVYKSYKTYLINVAGTTLSDYYKDYRAKWIEVNFEDSVSFRAIMHNGSKTNVRVVGIFSNETPTRKMKGYQKIIFNSLDYAVNVGDMFEFDDHRWLCIDTSKTSVSKSCVVARCSNSLFYNNAGDFVEIPYVVFDNIALTRMGIEMGRYLTVPNSRMMLMLPDTDVSRRIARNDIYELYSKGETKENYKVIDVNRARTPGLIILELDFSSEEQQLPSTETGCVIDGQSNIIKGCAEIYTAINYDNKNTTFDFEVINDIPLSAYNLEIVGGNTCKITAKESRHTLILRATDVSDGRHIDKTIYLIDLF